MTQKDKLNEEDAKNILKAQVYSLELLKANLEISQQFVKLVKDMNGQMGSMSKAMEQMTRIIDAVLKPQDKGKAEQAEKENAVYIG